MNVLPERPCPQKILLVALYVICLYHLPLAFGSRWSLAFGKSLNGVYQIESAPKSLEIM